MTTATPIGRLRSLYLFSHLTRTMKLVYAAMLGCVGLLFLAFPSTSRIGSLMTRRFPLRKTQAPRIRSSWNRSG